MRRCWVYLQMVSEAARLIAMQVVARSIGSLAHLGFLCGAATSFGAFLLGLTLDESLVRPFFNTKASSFRGIFQ